jgi:hypothetical protein
LFIVKCRKQTRRFFRKHVDNVTVSYIHPYRFF